MRVYHGSTVEILNPDLSYAKRNLDFGLGQIDGGIYGIQYLDAAYLVDDLLENERALIDMVSTEYK